MPLSPTLGLGPQAAEPTPCTWETTQVRILDLSSILVLGASMEAGAKVPLFNATCGGGIEVHADEGGPVYINGK